MRLAAALILLASAFALTGCHENVKPDPMPKTVYVEVVKFVRLGAELTAPCYDEPPLEQTDQEAKRLANLRHDSLTECSSRMARIRAVEDKAVTP